jgi:hypothetical protein
MIRPIGVVGGNCASPSTSCARGTSDDSARSPNCLGESKHLALGGSTAARGDWVGLPTAPAAGRRPHRAAAGPSGRGATPVVVQPAAGLDVGVERRLETLRIAPISAEPEPTQPSQRSGRRASKSKTPRVQWPICVSWHGVMLSTRLRWIGSKSFFDVCGSAHRIQPRLRRLQRGLGCLFQA